MSKLDSEIAKFMKLLEQKNIKEAKAFLDRIQNFQQLAQQVVNKSLDQALVKKKTTPLGVTSALYIYKQLLMRSQFDFLENDSNQKIHQILQEICQYKPNDPIDVRGNQFFVDKMKAKNSQDIELLGHTIVCLGLQIVQAMAQWYPNDYFTGKKSRYALYYQKFKQKKITFPDKTKAKFMKPDDKQKFLKNHKAWVQKMQQLYGESEHSGENKTPDGNTKNTTSVAPKNIPQTKVQNQNQANKTEIIKQNLQPQNKNKVDQNKPVIQSTLPQKVEQNKPIIQSTIPQKVDQNKPVIQSKLPQKVEQNKPVIHSTIPQKVEQNKPVIQSTLPQKVDQNKNQKQVAQSSLPINSKQNQKSGQLQKPKENPKFIAQQKSDNKIIKQNPLAKENEDLRIGINQKIAKQDQKKQVKKVQTGTNSSQQLKPKQKDIKEEIKPLQFTQIRKQILKSNIEVLRSSNREIFDGQRQPSARNIDHNLSIGKFKLQQPKQQQKIYVRVIQKPVPHRTQRRLQVPQTVHTHSQSPHEKFSKKQINEINKIFTSTQPANVDQNNYNERPQSQLQLKVVHRKKSVPKTEKKYASQYSPIRNQNFIRMYQTKTLSNFRNEKNLRKNASKIPKSTQSLNLSNLINNFRINQLQIPYLPNYFLPIDNKMQALVLQSLKVGQNIQPSKPFFKDQLLAIRLIKSEYYSYILSLQNVSHMVLSIEFSSSFLKKSRNIFTSQIVLKYQHKKKSQQTSNLRLGLNSFIDIPFQFKTSDANFKFLQFPIIVNNKLLTLHLPITLLDNGYIQKSINIEQIQSYIEMNGRIIKTSPVVLHHTNKHHNFIELPPFFSENDDRKNKILGFMCYQMLQNNYKIAKVNFYIKQINQNPLRHQIYALYDNRLEQNQNFAKVILQLLCFLMVKNQ